MSGSMRHQIHRFKMVFHLHNVTFPILPRMKSSTSALTPLGFFMLLHESIFSAAKLQHDLELAQTTWLPRMRLTSSRYSKMGKYQVHYGSIWMAFHPQYQTSSHCLCSGLILYIFCLVFFCTDPRKTDVTAATTDRDQSLTSNFTLRIYNIYICDMKQNVCTWMPVFAERLRSDHIILTPKFKDWIILISKVTIHIVYKLSE